HISSAMLVLYRLLAGGHCIVAARRGALQCVNRVLRSLTSFVVSEVFWHVFKIFLFLGQCRFKDAFGLLDLRQSALDFRATRFIHNPVVAVGDEGRLSGPLVAKRNLTTHTHNSRGLLLMSATCSPWWSASLLCDCDC